MWAQRLLHFVINTNPGMGRDAKLSDETVGGCCHTSSSPDSEVLAAIRGRGARRAEWWLSVFVDMYTDRHSTRFYFFE